MENNNKKMKIVISGSRSIDDTEEIFPILDQYKNEITLLVEGGARGVDIKGRAWALANDVPFKTFSPEWRDKDGNYRRQAGFERNKDMADYGDKVVAIWDGKSKGTGHMVDIMKAKGKPVDLFTRTITYIKKEIT